MIKTRRGDTLVEVLLATVILSIVLAGAFSLSNQAIQTGQGSLERTEAVNIVREYAESFRFIHGSETDGYQAAWDAVLAGASSNRPTYTDDKYCDTSIANPKYLNFAELGSSPVSAGNLVKGFNLPTTGGRLDYSGATDNNSDDLFAVWFEVYDSDPINAGTVDIHIRACWDTLGGDSVDRAGAVVRLTETRDT